MTDDGPISAEQSHRLTAQLEEAYASLADSARSGDEAARREMIATCRQYLLFIANQELDPNLRVKCGASDVVQNAMVQAVAKYDQFEGQNKAALLGWLRRILLNEIGAVRRQFLDAEKRDIRRENERMDVPNSDGEHLEVMDPETTPATEAGLREERARLQLALATLSADHQRVLQLRNWDRLPFAEIAVSMGRSEDAAKKLWARALEILKTALDRNDSITREQA